MADPVETSYSTLPIVGVQYMFGQSSFIVQDYHEIAFIYVFIRVTCAYFILGASVVLHKY